MSSIETPATRAVTRSLSRIILCLTISLAWPVWAQDDNEYAPMEVWLVTYGPGEISWQSFGHNAIWIRDQELELNHVFNFGFFDFRQEAFYQRFLQGKLLYFSAAQPAEREFSLYIDENRSIRAQRLNLSADQSFQLAEYLLSEVQPQNRDYLYDYYTNNCSTRVRDALDLALGGALAAGNQPVPASQTWRDHTRRLTIGDFWLYLGLELGLGSRVDHAISRWDEFFIPSELATAVASSRVPGPEGEEPLVLEDVMLFESSLDLPPPQPARWWPRYLLMGLALLTMAWLAGLMLPVMTPMRLVRLWLLLGGLTGAVLVFFWFFTDHQVARSNLNLLVFNPVWWLFVAWKHHRYAGAALLLISLLALLMVWLPPAQYNLDVLAAFLPLNFAAGLVLFRRPPRPTDLPGVPVAGDQ
jgi:hypothetical protein